MKGKEKEMRRRFLRAGLAVAGVTVTLVSAACSTAGGGAHSGGKPSGTVQLYYWGTATRTVKYNKIDALFEKAYPGTTVQASVADFSVYFNKLNVEAASKSIPCITTMQTRSLNNYTTNGIMMDLDPLVKSGQINVSKIPANVLDTGRGPDGKLYMIPFGVAWNALTINTALAKKYGIPLLQKGYTWSDYAAWLKTAASKLPAGVHATNDEGVDESTFSDYVISNGYKMFGPDGKIGFPKSVLTDYWNLWQSFAKAGYTNAASQEADEPAQPEQFYVTTGKVLSEETAGNALPAIQAANPSADMTTAAFPSGKAGLGNMFFVSGYSIPASCSNVATAAAYINFWTNNDAAANVFASDNGAVANADQLKTQIANPSEPGLQQVLQQYQYIVGSKVPNPVLPEGYSSVFEQSFLTDYQNIQFGKMSVAQAVNAFFSQANASLGTK